MQNWVIIDEKYLDYLRTVESRIPNSDYGANKFKPFFGVLFEQGDLAYVTQISHAQPRHIKMRNSLDFYKIYIPDKNPAAPDRLVAVVNLNYMFPVPKSIIKDLDFKDIDSHRTFATQRDKNVYIDLLKKELAQINTMGIEKKAMRIYNLKYLHPNDAVSLRCLDFKRLEEYAHKYLK